MTYLMVNLNDSLDCRDAIHQLRDLLRHNPVPAAKRRGRRPASAAADAQGTEPGGPAAPAEDLGAAQRAASPRARVEQLHALPLPKKLHRIAQRGVFRHLHRIASEVSTPLSLPELDRHLGFQPNKMRSLKAIMAKLEHRFGLQFLVLDPQGGVDESGNPRYVMPPRMRNQILRVTVA